ncbi:hypothetical protein GGX14DRAFT_324651, partial [Mycena pura]
LRSKCKHFRILVVGRANAGKTTLLKKVCNSGDDPAIFDARGKKVCARGSIPHSLMDLLGFRGIHDIEYQLVFKSNPRFIFYDSQGFESGSIDQVDKVKEFIKERSRGKSLSEQLHMIW